MTNIESFYQKIADSANELERKLFEIRNGHFTLSDEAVESAIRGSKNEEEIRFNIVLSLGQTLISECDKNNDAETATALLHRKESIRMHLHAPKYSFENAVIELDIPSGKIVISDSLFEVVPDIEENISINYGAGLKQYTEELNKNTGMAYVFGHNDPYLTHKADGTFSVMKPEWRELAEDPEIGDEEIDIVGTFEEEKFEPGEKVLASISTNLWAVCMIDLDKWIGYGGSPDGKSNVTDDYREYRIIDMVPGKYRVTVYTVNDQFEFDAHYQRNEYASIELVEAY